MPAIWRGLPGIHSNFFRGTFLLGMRQQKILVATEIAKLLIGKYNGVHSSIEDHIGLSDP
jgi:hypothetical protein